MHFDGPMKIFRRSSFLGFSPSPFERAMPTVYSLQLEVPRPCREIVAARLNSENTARAA